MSSELDNLITDMGQGSRRRGIKKGRKKIRTTVRRSTIEFTEEMDSIIKQHLFKHHKSYVWEVVYDGLRCLAEREGYDLSAHKLTE